MSLLFIEFYFQVRLINRIKPEDTKDCLVGNAMTIKTKIETRLISIEPTGNVGEITKHLKQGNCENSHKIGFSLQMNG